MAIPIRIQVSTIELSQFVEKNNLRVPHCHDLEESCDVTTTLPPLGQFLRRQQCHLTEKLL
jgi:hypothetical protein